MNNYSLRCLRLKDFNISYLRSRKYITVLKTFDSTVRHSKIDQCWIKQLGQRLCHSSLNQFPSIASVSVSDPQNTVQNYEVNDIYQQVALTTKGTASRCAESEMKISHDDSSDLDTCANQCNFICDVKCSDSQISDRIKSTCKNRIKSSENPTRCKFQKFHSHSVYQNGFQTPSHNKHGRTFQYRPVPSQTQSQRYCCARLFSSSAHSRSEFVARQEPPWRVLFFGTDQISVETLKRLHENMHSSYSVVDSLEVVSNVEKREVKGYAIEQGLQVYDWPIPAMPNKYDVGVLVSFGHLIPDDIIHMFPYGILNMHPSLLPRWRGASPIIHTILNGDPETGISIMEIRPKRFDVGPILMQRRFPVPPRSTSLQLSSILAPLGADMIIETLADLRTLERFEEEQDSAGVRYAHKLIKKNANIDWENQTCDEIDQQFRAISEVMPLKSRWKDHGAKLFDMVDPSLTNRLLEHSLIRGYSGDITQAVPGTPAYYYKLDCLLVKCKDGVVGFRNLSVKKPMTAMQFTCGYLAPPDGSVFESLENDLNKYVKKKRMKQRVKDGVVGFRNLSVKKPMTAMQFICGYLAPPDGSIFESLENDLNKYVKKKRMKQRVKV